MVGVESVYKCTVYVSIYSVYIQMIDLESNDDTWISDVKVSRNSRTSFLKSILYGLVQWLEKSPHHKRIQDIAHVRHIVKSDTLV